MGKRIHYAWVIAGITVVTLMASSGVRSTFGVFIKPLEQEFGWGRAGLSLVAALSLFIYGAAGPLAGFAVCLPVLALGVLEARPLPLDPDAGGVFLGEPLLFQWASHLVHGRLAAEQTLLLGPLGLAAWFGLFVTALNLIPIGQLDGGHVTYALLRDRARLVSRVGSWVCLALIYFGPNWILWALLVRLLGRRHPATGDDFAPLGRGRLLVAFLGLAVFVGCFVPNPIVWSWREFFEATGLAGLVHG